MNDQHDVHLLSGAYAVGALDDLERARFESHLETCADCRDEVAGLVDTAALLAETTATMPPPHVRDAVLAGITMVRPLPPDVSRPTAPGASEAPRRRWFPTLAAAAAVVAAVAAGVVVHDRVTGDDSAQAPRLSAVDRVLQAPDAQEFEHRIDGATATVVLSRSVGQAVIVTEDMPAAPEGKVYELWLQTPEDAMVSAGLMPAGEDQTLLLEGDASSAVGVGITIEPDGGSEEPTLPPVALIELA